MLHSDKGLLSRKIIIREKNLKDRKNTLPLNLKVDAARVDTCNVSFNHESFAHSLTLAMMMMKIPPENRPVMSTLKGF